MFCAKKVTKLPDLTVQFRFSLTFYRYFSIARHQEEDKHFLTISLNFQMRNDIKIMTLFWNDNLHNWLKICKTKIKSGQIADTLIFIRNPDPGSNLITNPAGSGYHLDIFVDILKFL
jgi:hypothetical protein